MRAEVSILVERYWIGCVTALSTCLFELFSLPAAADWTGAYVGAQAGMSRADLNAQQFGSFGTTRAAFGAHVGYNLALGIVVDRV